MAPTADPESGNSPHEPATVHATCCLVGEAGILIRGSSGAGKSSLARELIEAAAAAGRFARLVADDRVRLSRTHDRVLARPIPPLAGLIELRGLGLMRTPFRAACRLRLVVDLRAEPSNRLPEPGDLHADILGVRLARISGIRSEVAALARWRLRGRDDTIMTEQ